MGSSGSQPSIDLDKFNMRQHNRSKSCDQCSTMHHVWNTSALQDRQNETFSNTPPFRKEYKPCIGTHKMNQPLKKATQNLASEK